MSTALLTAVAELAAPPSGKPNPTCCRSVTDVDRERDLDCAHYDACLLAAGVKNWPSFNCRACALFGKARTNALRLEDFLSAGAEGSGNGAAETRVQPRKQKTTAETEVRGGFWVEVWRMFDRKPAWTSRELIEQMDVSEKQMWSALQRLRARGLIAKIPRSYLYQRLPGARLEREVGT